MSKEDWKETGKALGGAFKMLGKSIVKSIDSATDDVKEWANKDDQAEEAKKAEDELNKSAEDLNKSADELAGALNEAADKMAEDINEKAERAEDKAEEKEACLRDSWSATGKGLGAAFASLGKSIVKTVDSATESVTDWAKKDDDDKPEEKKEETEEVEHVTGTVE